MSETQTKTVAVEDSERATEHTVMATRLGDARAAIDAGYSEGDVIYTLIGPGIRESSHDLFKLAEAGSMTENQRDFLFQTPFGELEDGKTYDVSE